MAHQPNKALSRLIADVLECDLSKATNILRAILQTIKEALLRGESVQVRGFGTFRVLRRIHRPTPNNILTNDRRGRPVARAAGLLYYKPRRVVVFEPSLPLMAMLNLDTPNYKERRAQRRWTA